MLAAGGYGLAAAHQHEPAGSAVAGAALALTIGMGKEVADRFTGGHPSGRDLAWDAIGTATGLLVSWMFDRLVWTPISAATP